MPPSNTLFFLIAGSEDVTISGGKLRGSRILWSCEDESQVISPSYIEKNERVDGRFSSCYEEWYKSSW